MTAFLLVSFMDLQGTHTTLQFLYWPLEAGSEPKDTERFSVNK